MSEDTELQAIQQLLSALEPLESDARSRVLDYVFQRLDLGPCTSPGPGVETIPNPLAIDGAMALASGAALATARGCGNFVNPRPQTTRLPDGRQQVTIPNPATQVAY